MGIINTKIYKIIYDLIRKNKVLNHMANKVMYSELINKFPLYSVIYKKMLIKKAAVFIKVPSMIELEVTNKCNSRCIMCPDVVHMGNDFLEHDFFMKITKEAYDLGIRRMSLTGGEPLLDSRIFDKIEYAKKIGYSYVHLFSNGSLLGKFKQDKLLKSGLDSLTISIDSPIKEEYEAIRRTLNFDIVVRNIKSLYKQKNKLRLKKPIIRINMVALPENMNSRKLFINTFKKYADIVEIIDDHNFAGMRDDLGEYKEYFQINRVPCHLLFIKVVVNSSGCLKKCSIDYSKTAIIADLKKNNLKDALHKSRLVEIKKNHLKYDFSEPGCNICTHKESWWIDS